MDDCLMEKIEKIAEDTYYESISCYTHESTDGDDAKEMIKSIKDAMFEALKLINTNV